MDDLLLHPSVAYQLKGLALAKPHAVLVTGKQGAGKQTIGYWLAAELLDVKKPDQHPYFLLVTPEKLHISIENVRAIKQFLGKKTTGKAQIRRVVLITDAQVLTQDAQNALLKTLEEPPEDTAIIVTCSDITALRPTIRSRAQQLDILPVSLQQATEYFSRQGFTKQQVESAFNVSNGEVGLLAALLQEQTEHPLVQAIEQAKQLVQANKYERLVLVDELAKQKENLSTLLDGMQRITHSGLIRAAQAGNTAATKRFYGLDQAVMRAQSRLGINVNGKLLLTSLFLDM